MSSSRIRLFCSHSSSHDRPLRPSMSTDSIPDVTTDTPQASPYRLALQIPVHIREHCHIYLDEQLYTSALTLLSDLIASGASHPEQGNRPVIAPLPFHIELVSCLLVHPRYTSQAPPDERKELASRSITFLRNLLAILGPVNARLDEAFSPVADTSRSSRRTRVAVDSEDGTSGSESDGNPERMKGVIANKGRLWRCATDFWHIVGWIFNCSVKHAQRWKYWKVWLAYMLDVLDADWKERDRLDREDPIFRARLEKDPDAACQFKMLRGCLLVQYLSKARGRSSQLKRVVRSIFADGGPESLKEFPEVFSNETKAVRHASRKRKRGEKFGDYGDDEDDAEYASDQSTDILDGRDNTGPVLEQDPCLGGTESLALRQRVTTLLSRVAHHLPGEFTDVRELYDVIYTFVKPLPLPAFSLFTSPSYSSALPTVVYVSLCQLLLLRLLPNNAPRPHSVTNKASDELSQLVLEKCLLPFPANTSTVQDNAKVSILVENMLRLFFKACECDHTPALVAAVESGILARENKVKGEKRRKDAGSRSKAEESDMVWLKSSGERLRILVSWIEKSRKG